MGIVSVSNLPLCERVKMTYKRKTQDIFVIVSNYGDGWEDTTASDCQRDAINDLKAYRSNQPEYIHRLVKRRERIKNAD
jgi:hypothetical protein